METVGFELRKLAISRRGCEEKDLFARSAFNRFYYSAFLKTRSTLKILNPSWGKSKHANLPELLEGKVISLVKAELKKQVAQGLITIGHKSHKINSLTTATTELANLLRSAYELRCIADYEPEISVVIEDDKFSLQDITIDEAGNWHSRVGHFCGVILSAWRYAGLVH